MRALIAFLLLAAAAVTLALLFRLNTGYVLFVAPPYRVELSQNAFIIIARASASSLLYALLRAGVRACAAAAREVREGRRRRQFERFRASRTPPSSRCSKAATARRGSSPKRRWRFRSRRRSQRSSGARAALETRDYAAARPRCSSVPTRMRRISPCRG